ncbi:MAG: hypothetical protein AAGH79_06595 [Bacteroidota bacterium]
MKTWICLLVLMVILAGVQESASAEIRLRPSDYQSTVESGVSTTLDYTLDNQQKDTVYNVVVYLETNGETPDWLRWEPVRVQRLLPYEHYDISWELDVPFHRFSQYYDVKFRIEYGEGRLDSEKETLKVNPPDGYWRNRALLCLIPFIGIFLFLFFRQS